MGHALDPHRVARDAEDHAIVPRANPGAVLPPAGEPFGPADLGPVFQPGQHLVDAALPQQRQVVHLFPRLVADNHIGHAGHGGRNVIFVNLIDRGRCDFRATVQSRQVLGV